MCRKGYCGKCRACRDLDAYLAAPPQPRIVRKRKREPKSYPPSIMPALEAALRKWGVPAYFRSLAASGSGGFRV